VLSYRGFSLNDLDGLLPIELVMENVSESIPVGSEFRHPVAHSSPKFARSSSDSYPPERLPLSKLYRAC